MLPPIVVVFSGLPTDEVMRLSIALNIPLTLTVIFPPSASDADVLRLLFCIPKVLPGTSGLILISPAFPSPVLALDRVALPCSVTLFALSVMLPALRVPWVSALTLPPAMVSVGAVRVILGRGSPGRSTPLVTLAEIVGFVRVMAFASTEMLPPWPVLAALVAIVLLVSVTASAGEASPWMVIEPALPVAVPVLLLEIAEVPIRFSVPTFAVMLPALPLLLVLVVIVLSLRFKAGVLMITVPASPAAVVELVMLLPPARLTVLPVAVIVMAPAFCGPAVAAETVDALLRVKEPAATTMSPPAPVPSAFVNRELLVRVMAVAAVPRPPRPWTVTVPAFPLAVPLLLLEISALLVRVSVPTFIVMSPARPISKVLLLI